VKSRHLLSLGLILAGAVAVAGMSAASAPSRTAVAPRAAISPEIAAFYAARGGRPLWVRGGRLKPEAEALLSALAFAGRNGFDPARYGAAEIRSWAERGKAGDKAALARAELQLSRGFTLYAGDLRKPGRMLYVERGLAPQAADTGQLLAGAATAPSLIAYLRHNLAMNPLFETLRAAYGRRASAMPPEARRTVERNLERLRAIPANPGGRWILVDAGGARLWMMDGRRVAGSMRVIVGKPRMQTPVMAARLRYAILNPYWNLPPDLVRERAKRVLRQGPGFLRAERLQLLSDWGRSPRVLSPSQVDWRAVAAGREYLRMRQLPGGANVMGAVKFMMPNDLGIYLHDFPDKSLFARSDRHLSSGCVRLEDAPRLARWLFGGNAPRAERGAVEHSVNLPTPVPVYIVYLTAFPAPDGIALRNDVYGLDKGGGAAPVVVQDRADRRP
jgi:murein L,D-transpeptidase YcbB/YkuD